MNPQTFNEETQKLNAAPKYKKSSVNTTKCLLGVLVLMAAEITLFSASCLLFPSWNTYKVNKTSEGLVLKCTDTYDPDVKCEWQHSRGGWFKPNNIPTSIFITAILWTVGIVIYISSGFLVICLCANSFQNNYCCIGTSILGSGLSACTFLTAVIVWGITSQLSFDRNKEAFFDWGYYLALLVTLLAFAKTLLLLYTVTEMFPETPARIDHSSET